MLLFLIPRSADACYENLHGQSCSKVAPVACGNPLFDFPWCPLESFLPQSHHLQVKWQQITLRITPPSQVSKQPSFFYQLYPTHTCCACERCSARWHCSGWFCSCHPSDKEAGRKRTDPVKNFFLLWKRRRASGEQDREDLALRKRRK